MPVLSTPRLLLLPLNRAMIAARLEQDTFTLSCETPDGPLDVHFPAEWPGDPLGFFPDLLRALPESGSEVDPDASFTVVTRDGHEAVGQIGAKGQPGDAGELEIGYGVNPSAWGRGYATEAVGALVAHLLTRPGVRVVTAETSLSNRASERVLEKLGFIRAGSGWNEDDGELTLWQYGG